MLLGSLVALLSSCGGGPEGEGDEQGPEPPDAPETFLDGDLTAELPGQLSELGLYPDPSDRNDRHERATVFVPAFPLWTNGAEKERFVVVPEGETIDSSGEDWAFPEGTLFFKTFSYPNAEGDQVPVETRVLRRTADGYEFSAYLWNADATDATLLDGKTSTPVAVEVEGERFEHLVPSRLECRSCHESQEPQVLGFDELRLASPLPGHDETQLVELYDRGIIATLAEDPRRIDESDPLTRSVLEYFQGNCVHCHNAGFGPNSAFSLDYPDAVSNLVDVDTTSELLHGLRVKPGSPEESAIYLALTATSDSTTAQPMPPLGVQRRDTAAAELVREWILSLDPQ